MERAVTIKDIAARFHCSPSTVSRALNNHPSINEYTRKHIQEYAEQVGYQKNSVSLSLLNKKTFSVGVIVPYITGFFNASVLDGIQSVLEPLGYTLTILHSKEFFEPEVNIVEKLIANRVDGIFISAASETRDFSHYEKILRANIPLILFDRDCPFPAHKVRVDHFSGAVMATEHLIRMGCKRIAHLKGPEGLSVSEVRLEGYLEALRRNNLPIDESLIRPAGFKAMKGVYPTRQLLELPYPPDGIFAVNDNVAIAAMRVIREKGLKIPDDVAVVGFDNEPHAQFLTPSLTTIEQPSLELGREVAHIFLNHIKPENEPYPAQEIILPTQLIIRESSLK